MRTQKIELNYYGEYIDHNLFLPEEKGNYPLIIHLNGMPGHSPTEQKERLGADIVKEGYAFFAFDYPGVRKSTGTYSYYAAHGIIDKILAKLVKHEEIDPSKIGLLGESFGGAKSICYTARDERVKALAVRSPVYDTNYVVELPVFDVLAKIWRRNNQMRFPDDDLRKLFRIQARQFNPKVLIKEIKVPIFVMAGGKDEILAKEGFEKLQTSINGKPSEFYMIEEADHNFTNKEHFSMFKEKAIAFFNKQLK